MGSGCVPRTWESACYQEGGQAIAKDLVTFWVNKFSILDFPGAENKHDNHNYVADFHGFSVFFGNNMDSPLSFFREEFTVITP